MHEGQLGVFWLIIMTCSICSLIFGIAYFRNKENMAMIDRGMSPRAKEKNQPKPFTSLKWGSLLAGAGLGLLIAFFIDTFAIKNVDSDSITALYFGLIGVGSGLGFLVSYFIEMKYWNKNNDSQTRE
jgi:hypothetical protein